MVLMNTVSTAVLPGSHQDLFTGLVPGSYNVRIRDAANITCMVVMNPALAITQPAALAGTVSRNKCKMFWCERRYNNNIMGIRRIRDI